MRPSPSPLLGRELVEDDLVVVAVNRQMDLAEVAHPGQLQLAAMCRRRGRRTCGSRMLPCAVRSASNRPPARRRVVVRPESPRRSSFCACRRSSNGHRSGSRRCAQDRGQPEIGRRGGLQRQLAAVGGDDPPGDARLAVGVVGFELPVPDRVSDRASGRWPARGPRGAARATCRRSERSACSVPCKASFRAPLPPGSPGRPSRCICSGPMTARRRSGASASRRRSSSAANPAPKRASSASSGCPRRTTRTLASVVFRSTFSSTRASVAGKRAVSRRSDRCASVPLGSTALPRAASCRESVPPLKTGAPADGRAACRAAGAELSRRGR